MVVVSGAIKSLVIQRRNAMKLAEMARTETDAAVLRDGKWHAVRSAQVVPGDVVRVDEGTVPCDIALCKGGAVVNESMLTGEPMPVQRFCVEADGVTLDAGTHKKCFLF